MYSLQHSFRPLILTVRSLLFTLVGGLLFGATAFAQLPPGCDGDLGTCPSEGMCDFGYVNCQPFGDNFTEVVPEGQRCRFTGAIQNSGGVHCEWPELTISGNGCSFNEEYVACEPLSFDVTCEAGSVLFEANDSADFQLDIECEPACDVNMGQACTVGEGVCSATGTIQCDGSCSVQPGEPGEEICGNQLDDNCNGQVDENNHPDFGDSCSEGVGACLGTGVISCTGDCSAVPGEPGVEVCDNSVDDDCDGQVDEVQECPIDLCPDDPEKTEPGGCGCGVADTDLNQDEVLDCNQREDVCPEDEECVFEELESFACSNVNYFLRQINIASIKNLLAVPLAVELTYRDLNGVVRGTINDVISGNNKKDYIVNDMGSQIDTYGTVCASVASGLENAWSGIVTTYKPNERPGFPGTFGSSQDFALVQPFTNARTGIYTQPVNTSHLGVHPADTIANWFTITDANPGDGIGLRGTVEYLNQNGEVISSDTVFRPDGGRFDFSAHEGVAGFDNSDAVGFARYTPEDLSAGFFGVLKRYWYNCPPPRYAAFCEDFHTAMALQQRPATNVATSGGSSTVDGEISIVELNNIGGVGLNGMLDVYSGDGLAAGSETVFIPAGATRHVIVNQFGATGFLAANSVGAAHVDGMGASDTISAVSVFYKLDKDGALEYAYNGVLAQPPGVAQLVDFNTFIGQVNDLEIHNPGTGSVNVNIEVVDVVGSTLLTDLITLDAKQTWRESLTTLPADTLGVVRVQSDSEPVNVRNYVRKGVEYVLPIGGR